MKLFISGSRDCYREMVAYAQRVVRRAKQRGDVTIIVGDAPGIDAEVIDQCDRLNVPVIVYGAYGKLRHKSLTGINAVVKTSYTDRDEHLIAQCDVFIGIWNGKSKGTDRNFTRAIQEGKAAYLWRDGELFDPNACTVHPA